MSTQFPEILFRLRLRTVLLLSLLVRLVWACVLQYLLDYHWHRDFLIEGDANGYWQLARNIAEGRDFAIYNPPRFVLRMPGFPALLALSIHLFGESLFAARLFLTLVGTAGCGLVYLLARQLSDVRTASLAGLLAAFSPVLVGFSPVILSETTFSVCLVGSLIACTEVLREFSREQVRPVRVSFYSLLTGLLISLGVFVRPSWLLWGPVSAALVLLPFNLRTGDRSGETRGSCCGRLRLVSAVLILAGTVAPLIPWGLRNQHVTGHFVLTTLWMGPSLYDGLNPQATGDSDMTFFDAENLMATQTEFEVNEEYKRRAWAFALENPGRALELAWIKFLRYWNPVPNAAQFGNMLIRLAVAGGTLPIFVLALIGTWRSRQKLHTVILCAGPVLYFCTLHLLFVSSLRYRLPAEYPLLILAALGGRSLFASRTWTEHQDSG